jgi:hypothetical protein
MSRRKRVRPPAPEGIELTNALVKAFGNTALEASSAEDFIFVVQRKIIKKVVAKRFFDNFRIDAQGKKVSNTRAAKLFIMYCKLLKKYARTPPEF